MEKSPTRRRILHFRSIVSFAPFDNISLVRNSKTIQFFFSFSLLNLTLSFVLILISDVFWMETLHRSIASQTSLNVDVLSANVCLKDEGWKVGLSPYYTLEVSEMSQHQNNNKNIQKLCLSTNSLSLVKRWKCFGKVGVTGNRNPVYI